MNVGEKSSMILVDTDATKISENARIDASWWFIAGTHLKKNHAAEVKMGNYLDTKFEAVEFCWKIFEHHQPDMYGLGLNIPPNQCLCEGLGVWWSAQHI